MRDEALKEEKLLQKKSEAISDDLKSFESFNIEEGKLVPQNLAEVFDLITFEDFKNLKPVE